MSDPLDGLPTYEEIFDPEVTWSCQDCDESGIGREEMFVHAQGHMDIKGDAFINVKGLSLP
jgi:hypothetical protein